MGFKVEAGERISVVWEASRFAVFVPGRAGQSGTVRVYCVRRAPSGLTSPTLIFGPLVRRKVNVDQPLAT
jgi:hypothetical protein